MASEPRSAAGVDAGLEREYNLRLRHPERGAVYERFAQRSAALRCDERRHVVYRYGASAKCVIDFFPAAVTRAAPLFLFIHGGYWRALDRSIFSFLARPWLDRGVHVALPGYDLAPTVSVRRIVDEMHGALDWLLTHAPQLQIDSGRCIVSGHSAGAHLGALLLNKQSTWSAAGFAGISGVYDLQPLLSTTVNLDVRLDAHEAQALSPALHRADARPRYLCAAGSAETDGFRGQSRDYVEALRRYGCDARMLDVPLRTHFDILDDLADPATELFRSVFALLPPP